MGTIGTYNFGKAKLRHNTFIGGVAASLNTPALLAAELGVIEQRIRLFEIRGNDIRCCVVGDYELYDDFMTDKNNLTYFIDSIGLVKRNYKKLFMRCFNLEKVYLPGLLYLSGNPTNWVFENTYGQYPKFKILYIGNALAIGDNHLRNIDVFRFDFPNNLKIYAHKSLQTSNNGGIEGDLAAFMAAGTNSVVFIENYQKPERITDLSIGLKTSTTAQILFSNPDSTNTLQEFEVSIDGVIWQTITASGQYITGLTAETEYKNITVRASDIYYNRAEEESNEVTITTDVEFEIQLQQYLARITANGWNTLTEFQKIVLNDWIKETKANGNAFDNPVINVPSLGTSTNSLLNATLINIKDPNRALATVHGGVTLTPNGYKFDGTTGYVDLKYNPFGLGAENFGVMHDLLNDFTPSTTALFGCADTGPTRRFGIMPNREVLGNGDVRSQAFACDFGTNLIQGANAPRTIATGRIDSNKYVQFNKLREMPIVEVKIPQINYNYMIGALSNKNVMQNFCDGTSRINLMGAFMTKQTVDQQIIINNKLYARFGLPLTYNL